MGRGLALTMAAAGAISFIIVGNGAVAVALAVVVAIAWVRGLRVDHSKAGTRTILIESGLITAGFLIYEFGRLHTVGSYASASANAETLIGLQRSMGLLFEGQLQSLLLQSDRITWAFNYVYSYSFLAFLFGALFWLLLADRKNYRLLRDSLAVSGALTIATIAAFPVAPPRLMSGLGIDDTVVVLGREHGFANEFAAVPSLHVGWIVLVGYVLGRSIGGRLGWIVGAVPGTIMGVTVIVTGNHYWLDGVIGVAYSMAVPAALALERPLANAGARIAMAGRRTTEVLARSRSAQFSAVTLTTLLTYLIIGRIVDPGFTDFWGYLLFQMAFTLFLLLAGDVIFADQGGLSWPTHVIAVGAGYLDVFGTDGNLYARIDEYDKITHFAGVAAVTSGVYDCFRAMNLRRGGTWPAGERYILAVSIGVAVGVSWEIWELIGDRVFHTTRIGGTWDTTNDLVMDTLGAFGAGTLLWWLETQRQGRQVDAPADGVWQDAAPGGGGGASG